MLFTTMAVLRRSALATDALTALVCAALSSDGGIHTSM
jgi:hypothetical protein